MAVCSGDSALSGTTVVEFGGSGGANNGPELSKLVDLILRRDRIVSSDISTSQLPHWLVSLDISTSSRWVVLKLSHIRLALRKVVSCAASCLGARNTT